ncbi:MAG: hypothetical protein AVDCRST_MAG54-1802, partial [uncultured Actinomycetospora sp.]
GCARRCGPSSPPAGASPPRPGGCGCTATPSSTGWRGPTRCAAGRWASAATASTSSWPCSRARGCGRPRPT